MHLSSERFSSHNNAYVLPGSCGRPSFRSRVVAREPHVGDRATTYENVVKVSWDHDFLYKLLWFCPQVSTARVGEDSRGVPASHWSIGRVRVTLLHGIIGKMHASLSYPVLLAPLSSLHDWKFPHFSLSLKDCGGFPHVMAFHTHTCFSSYAGCITIYATTTRGFRRNATQENNDSQLVVDHGRSSCLQFCSQPPSSLPLIIFHWECLHAFRSEILTLHRSHNARAGQLVS